MTWTKISDEHFDRPEVMDLSRTASLLHIEALTWCNRLLTDGALPRAALRRCTTSTDPEADADELVKAGLWEVTPDGWRLDWSDQRRAEVVVAERAENKRRQDTYRERGRRHNRGDHAACTDKCPARRNAVSNGVANALPDPSRPVPTDREGSRGIGDIAPDDSMTETAYRPPRPSPTARTAKSAPIAATEVHLPHDFDLATYEAEDEHIEIFVEIGETDHYAAALGMLRRLAYALSGDNDRARALHRCPRTEGNQTVCGIAQRQVIRDDEGNPQFTEIAVMVPAEFARAWIDCIRWELSYGMASETSIA